MAERGRTGLSVSISPIIFPKAFSVQLHSEAKRRNLQLGGIKTEINSCLVYRPKVIIMENNLQSNELEHYYLRLIVFFGTDHQCETLRNEIGYLPKPSLEGLYVQNIV